MWRYAGRIRAQSLRAKQRCRQLGTAEAAPAELLVGLLGSGKTQTLLNRMLRAAETYSTEHAETSSTPGGPRVRLLRLSVAPMTGFDLHAVFVAVCSTSLCVQYLMLVRSEAALSLASNQIREQRPLGCTLCEVCIVVLAQCMLLRSQQRHCLNACIHDAVMMAYDAGAVGA